MSVTEDQIRAAVRSALANTPIDHSIMTALPEAVVDELRPDVTPDFQCACRLEGGCHCHEYHITERCECSFCKE